MVDPDRHDIFTESVHGRHGTMRFFANDTVIGAALRLYGEWAENELRLFHHFIPSGGTVLDVGGFIGTHALAFSEMVGPDGHVLSFEPQAASFALLEENVRHNHRINVRIHNAAVGSRLGDIQLAPMNVGAPINFGSLTIYEGGTGTSGEVDVATVVTIDSLELGRCDFIKLDVEGAEDSALDGARDTIARLKPVIYAECNSLSDAARSFALLTSFGYSLFLHVVDAFNPDNFEHADRNIFGNAREAGLIAVPPELADKVKALVDPAWQLFELATLDDLAYGLLQKPQYFDEILRTGAAAKGGGTVVNAVEHRARLDEIDVLREGLQREIAARQAAEAQRDDIIRSRVEDEQHRAQLETLIAEQHSELAAALHDLAVEREHRRQSQDWRQGLLAALARLRGAKDESAWTRASNLFKWIGASIRAKLRDNRHVEKYRRKLKRQRPEKGTGAESIATPGTAPLPTIEDHDAVVGAVIRLKPLRSAAPAPAPSTRPLLVCLSHVAPYPPRAGNEYRIQRLLAWIESIGWDVALLVCPLPGGGLSEAQSIALAERYRNVVVVGRDGELRHHLSRSDLAAALATLDGVKVEDFAQSLGEDREEEAARLLPITRTFCPDVLLETLRTIDATVKPSVVQVNYGFMARVFPLLRQDTLKIVDTHDVFSTKMSKVVRFGITDPLALSSAEERRLLQSADILLAIQPDEAEELRALNTGARILTVGVDMPPPPVEAGIAGRPVALMVASANDMNRKGLKDFLRFAWPLVLKAVPDAEFHVVGSVGEALTGHEPNVRWLGHVDNLDDAYGQARLAVNPAVAGTGLKIKTLEALAKLRPIVVWPSGIDGLPPELRAYCQCVGDWFEFARCVIRDLTEPDAQSRLVEARDRIAELLSQDRVYAEFGTLLKNRR